MLCRCYKCRSSQTINCNAETEDLLEDLLRLFNAKKQKYRDGTFGWSHTWPFASDRNLSDDLGRTLSFYFNLCQNSRKLILYTCTTCLTLTWNTYKTPHRENHKRNNEISLWFLWNIDRFLVANLENAHAHVFFVKKKKRRFMIKLPFHLTAWQ